MPRTTNDVSRNSKVGGLYDAYNEVMTYALDQGCDYIHILQHDMQMLWWDQAVTSCAVDIFAEYPECVNIQTLINYRLLSFSDDLECLKPRLMFYTKYGLTDTGLYDMSSGVRTACASATESRHMRASTFSRDSESSGIPCPRLRRFPGPR